MVLILYITEELGIVDNHRDKLKEELEELHPNSSVDEDSNAHHVFSEFFLLLVVNSINEFMLKMSELEVLEFKNKK